MLKPKPRGAQRYWETLSDEQLLDAELTTGDPEALDGLVRELPPATGEFQAAGSRRARGLPQGARRHRPFRSGHRTRR